MKELREFKTFAMDVADRAGALTLQYFRQSSTTVENKATRGAYDPATIADKTCERFIRQRIKQRYPAHGILGEEFEDTQSTSEWEWVIDPIDGTRAFISGFTHWGVLLGLKHEQRPILGVLAQPFTQELFVGDCTSAYWHRGGRSQALKSSRCKHLRQATLATTDPRLFKEKSERAAYDRVEHLAKLVRYGNDCYQYAMLAHGHVDVVIENCLNPWDIEPLLPIVKGAGGMVVNWSGGDDLSEGHVVAAANQELLDQVLKQLCT